MASVLPIDKQIAIIAALTEGVGVRVVERLTGVYPDTIMRLACGSGKAAPLCMTARWSISKPAASSSGRISTSYIERQNLSLCMGQRRFTRLTNSFSKKLRNHKAAVALYVAHYNLCRVHETLRVTPAMALGLTDHIWSIKELVSAAKTEAPITDRPRFGRFTVIQGGKT